MMRNKTMITGVIMDESSTISWVEVCHQCHISEDELVELMEHGLFDKRTLPLPHVDINHPTLLRIQSACRLRQDLGINLVGAVLVLELLDDLERVRRELTILQRHVGQVE